MAVMKGRAVINLLAICLIVAVIAGTEISSAEGKCCWKKQGDCCKGHKDCKKHCGGRAKWDKGSCYCYKCKKGKCDGD